MHFETSISLATSVSFRAGGGTVEAERRTRSASPRPDLDVLGRRGRQLEFESHRIPPVPLRSQFASDRRACPEIKDAKVAFLGVRAFGEGNNIRPGDRLDIDEERLEFRGVGVGIADKGRQRIRAKAFFGLANKAPMQRHADDMHWLAVADQRVDPLGHHGLGLH